MYNLKYDLEGNSISKKDLLWPGTEIPGGLGELGSKSYKELKLENKITALEERLRESENICSVQKEQIENLHWDLCDANRRFKNLDNKNSHKKIALAVLGVFFASSLIIICFPHQSSDMFISYYAAGKNSLNALVANPLFHRLSGLKISMISSGLFWYGF